MGIVAKVEKSLESEIKGVIEYNWRLIDRMDGEDTLSGYYSRSNKIIKSIERNFGYINRGRRYRRLSSFLKHTNNVLLDTLEDFLNGEDYFEYLDIEDLERAEKVIEDNMPDSHLASLINKRIRLLKEISKNKGLKHYIGEYLRKENMIEVSGLGKNSQGDRIKKAYPKTSEILKDTKGRERLHYGGNCPDDGDVKFYGETLNPYYKVTIDNCVTLLVKGEKVKLVDEGLDEITRKKIEEDIEGYKSANEIAKWSNLSNATINSIISENLSTLNLEVPEEKRIKTKPRKVLITEENYKLFLKQ